MDNLKHNTFKQKGDQLIFTRLLDAPLELVWKVWTAPEHLKEWWGPKERTIDIIRLDFKPGGIFHYKMTDTRGNKEYGLFIYEEINKPHKIVWKNSFADEKGNPIKPPFSDKFPKQILNTLTFYEQNDKTTLQLKCTPIDATSEEVGFFNGMKGSMKQGYNGTFEKLTTHLNKVKHNGKLPKKGH